MNDNIPYMSAEYGNGQQDKAKQMFASLSPTQQTECVDFLSGHMWYDVLDYDELGDFELFINFLKS
jgi:hypothetical protein